MSKKICSNCGEMNSGSAMYCVSCNDSLRDATINEDSFTPIKKHSNNSSSYGISRYHSGEVTIGGWMVILILSAIPIVNLIMMLIISFAGDNESLQNFGRASLILGLIGLILLVFLRGCSY